ALWIEQTDLDGRARAGKRKKGHREMRILDRERKRRTHLIAVERAMAGSAQPAGGVTLPIFGRRPLGASGVARRGAAGAVALVALPAGTEIFVAGADGKS